MIKYNKVENTEKEFEHSDNFEKSYNTVSMF